MYLVEDQFLGTHLRGIAALLQDMAFQGNSPLQAAGFAALGWAPLWV